MESELIYRKAAASDMERIMRLQMDIFHGEQKIPAESIASFMDCKPQCWVADHEGTVVGAIAVWEEGGQMHIGRFVIDKAWRGKGLGNHLCALAFKELFEQPVESVYMETREITTRMVLKMGGQIVGETVPFYEGTVTPLVLTKKAYLENLSE